MKPICDILEERISGVMAELAGDGPRPSAVIKATGDAKFGDYQANGVMGLAKRLKLNPRELATQVVAKLDLSDMCQPPEIAGPGFINLRLRTDWLAARLAEAIGDKNRLGIDPRQEAPTTVVDFSGPNVAKQMHVGHLRSTIIGDTIARVLEFWYGDGAKIIRQNHVGDWGTQFGMLIAYGRQHTLTAADIADMEAFYRQAKALDDADPEFSRSARDCVVQLQRGEAAVKSEWKAIVDISLAHCQDIYQQLGVLLNETHVRGESFYNDRLPGVIEDLKRAGLLRTSDGAQCVFLEGFKTKEGEPLPLIVQKSDGAYLYATTDLAAIRFRAGDLHAQRMIYVTDSRQKQHFEMVFACGRQVGWAGEGVSLEHVPFGSVLGDDGKPFKTRSGENVKLKDLLDEAVSRALKVVEEKNPGLPDEQKRQIARAVGIGAVKYADLSNDLVKDYVFNWDRMLALEGNTAPYLQYAFARVQSIFRKGEVDVVQLLGGQEVMHLTEKDELVLAKLLLRYGEIIEAVARDLRPHFLTTYLFDLAQAFSGFYTNCPVLKAENDAICRCRLMLCYHTARILKHGLGLLGITTIDQM